jgi:hypothetical protein
MRHQVHEERYDPPHEFCPDLACCACECRTCKRAWFAAGRPSYRDCKLPQTVTFADLHGLFHTLWGRAVGTMDYNKKDWLRFEKMIEDAWRLTGFSMSLRRD